MTFDTLHSPVRYGVGLRPTQELPFIEQRDYYVQTDKDRQTDSQTDIIRPFPRWKRCERRREERTRSMIIAPWCCIRQLSTPPVVAPLVNDGLRWVVDRLVQVSTAVAHISNGVARTRGEEAGGRARSRGSLSFFLTVVLAFRTYVCRGSYAPSSASKRADFLLGLPLIYRRRDGIIRFTTTDRRDASRDTLSERDAPHAHGAVWEKERKREQQYTAGPPRSCGCCARLIHRSGCCGRCLSFAMMNGGCGRCYAAPMVPHWTTAGVPWENMRHAVFNAQVRWSSTAGPGSDSSMKTSEKFRIVTALERTKILKNVSHIPEKNLYPERCNFLIKIIDLN